MRPAQPVEAAQSSITLVSERVHGRPHQSGLMECMRKPPELGVEVGRLSLYRQATTDQGDETMLLREKSYIRKFNSSRTTRSKKQLHTEDLLLPMI